MPQRVEDEMVRAEDAILQTKVIRPNEVRQKADSWRPAIVAEITLFQTKEALQVIRGQEVDQGAATAGHPFQGGDHRQGGAESGNRRGKKNRIVACGNFELCPG